jgi:hypothetical protein
MSGTGYIKLLRYTKALEQNRLSYHTLLQKCGDDDDAAIKLTIITILYYTIVVKT